MELSTAGLRELERSEGFSSKPYWDAIGKCWTIGFGETKGITAKTRPITRAEGERQLRARFKRDYAPALRPFIKLRGFNQNRYDALASFIWNCGVGAVSTATRVGRLLRQQKWTDAGAALLAWCKAGGRVIVGLLNRRQRERALFLLPASRTPRSYLTSWELKHAKVLERERRTAKRHGGWEKVGGPHLATASRSKQMLRERLAYLKGQDPHKAYRRQRIAALTEIIG